MCGIFGYFGKNKVSMHNVIELLQILEMQQHKDLGEKKTVGGHGAGVGFLDESGKMVIYKVGKTNASPAKDLSETTDISEARSNIVLGHVRYASPNLKDSIQYREATQPYKVECLGSSKIISAHNGKVENYMLIRRDLSREHSFESEKAVRLVDSEVIPHLFEEKLVMCFDEVEARKKTLESLEGNNAVVLLSLTKKTKLLHVLHKGHSRGMHIWENDKGEIILCSREEPLQQVFGGLLREGNFKKDLSIVWKEDRQEQRTYKVTTYTQEVEEKLREVTIQTQITWAVLLLTCFVGLVELLPELRLYYDMLWFSTALIVVYLVLATGLSYSIIRFSIATLFVLEWRRLLPKEVREKVVYLSPLYEKILFDREKKLRKWIVYLGSLLSFIFWCIILVGKILSSG